MSGFVTIDGIRMRIDGQRNLLELVRQAGIDLPTFCYNSELSVYGACRMCVVENDRGAVISSCSTPSVDGMVLYTHTPRLLNIRKMLLELLLANHDRDCTACTKNGRCKLQDLCARFGVERVRFPARDHKLPLDLSSPSLIRDNNKCILCGDCVRMCSEVQGIGAIDFAYRGAKVEVMSAYNRGLGEVNCVNCGQCVAVCPTGALAVRSEINQVWTALAKAGQHVVVQVAPAVRVAIAEEFGLVAGSITTGKMVAAIRRLGFARVFDTTFTADLTTIEETNEFINRLLSGARLPQFTSCCPAWVKCAEQHYPEKLELLSTCRSPQAMFGSLLKEYYPLRAGLDKKDIFVVSVMPCTAKKFEAGRPEFAPVGRRDVDAVLTTQELARMIKAAGIVFDELKEQAFDEPFSFGTGSGVIYGASGGVATAVVREATAILTGERQTDLTLAPVPELPGVRAAEVQIGERTVRLAVVSGLGNARNLIAAMDHGEPNYDIVEVMACPGGCAGGGGQPVPNETAQRQARALSLFGVDQQQDLRLAQDNPSIKELYQNWLGKPNSQIAHGALHTHYGHRRRISEEVAESSAGEAATQEGLAACVKVCVGTSCYLHGARGVLRRFSEEIEELGLEEKVELGAAFCFEQCDLGPNVLINGHEYHCVQEEEVPELLSRALSSARASAKLTAMA